MARIESNYFFEDKIPFSFQLSYQKSNFYEQNSLNKFGFSDFGATFLYHNYKDKQLGKNYGLYIFMEYYLINPTRNLLFSFRLSQGIAYNTNPYDRFDNPKNKFFGTHLLLPIDAFLFLRYPKIIGNWGLQAGLGIFHYSNGNLQSPNYGSNIPSFNFGINYDFRNAKILKKKKLSYNNDWHFNVFLRFGINESDYIDSGQYPFYIPGFKFEKHLSFRNKITFGSELFLSYFLKEQIAYESIAFPEYKINKNTDFKRIGVFAEHEFFYGKFGIGLSFGYYIYYPYHFETRFYNRLALNFYLSKKIGLSYSLKVHGINRAEAMELGISYNVF